jgi:predicted phage terminase large subunit-like protein
VIVFVLLMSIILERTPVPIYRQQADFLALSQPITGFVGGRGVGKTRIGGYKVFRNLRDEEPALCVSPDAGVVTETTLPTCLELAKELGIYVGHKMTPYPKIWFRTQDNGTATIVFRSGEKPKKLHGPNYALVWIDEASLQSKDVFLDVMPTLRFKGKMGPMQMTFTPKGKSNWTFDVFYEVIQDDDLLDIPEDQIDWFGDKPYRRKANSRLIHARSTDNPFLPDNFVDVLRSNMSAQLAQQELEGDFIEMSGMMFQRHWFQQVDSVPREATRVRYWDRASSHNSGCETAGMLMAYANGVWYIEDLIHGHWSARERDSHIVATAEKDDAKYHGEVIIYAEQEGGSGGKEVMENMILMLAGYPVHRDVVSGNKLQLIGGMKLPNEAKVKRAMPLQSQAEGGNIRVLRAGWTNYFLDQIVAFPESTLCDAVDAASGAFNKLTKTAPRDIKAAEKSRVEDYQLPAQKFGAMFALEQTRNRQKSVDGRRRARRLFDR